MTEQKTEVSNRPTVTATDRGLQLRTLDDMYRFAQFLSASGLAPRGIETPQAILIALQMGAELGLAPMQSIQNVAVISGKPCVYGDATIAVCRASGLFDEEVFDESILGEGEGQEAVCTVRRLPSGKPLTRRFSVADAKVAGLWKKQGPWQQYPKRMLQMRARSLALRDAFSDVLRGVEIAEEVRDQPASKVLTADAQEPLAALTASLTEGMDAAAREGTPADEPHEAQEGSKEAASAGEISNREFELASIFDSLDTIRACMDRGNDLLDEFPLENDQITAAMEGRIEALRKRKGKA